MQPDGAAVTPPPDLMATEHEGVFVARRTVPRIAADHLAFIKACAATHPRRRARICLHKSPRERLHDMIIAIAPDCYIRPHKHLDRAETFHLIEGAGTVVIFGEQGAIDDRIHLGAGGRGENAIAYRLDAPRYHTILPRTEMLVIHETTSGPFAPERTIAASWAPPEGGDERDVRGFLQRLSSALERMDG
ncbi:MAG: cupin fold metalloprotein, WbuC family [Zetaproteobacteria bacterium]|nr:MAG: cupin fold metalloprotein, WbuC family [Zetaproteobacteria bacterium]